MLAVALSEDWGELAIPWQTKKNLPFLCSIVNKFARLCHDIFLYSGGDITF